MARKETPSAGADRKNSRPFDLDKQTIDDLYDEAKNWLDGTEITTEGEAEAVEKLLEMAKAAAKDADAHRKEENKPFDEGKAEVQARFNPILERAKKITDACKVPLTAWRKKVEERQRAEAAEVARAAEEKRLAAEETLRKARGDLGAMEVAEGVAQDADRLERTAKKLEKNAGKGIGLRTVYINTLDDPKLTIAHYWRTDPEWLTGIIQQRVNADVRMGARSIPGVTINEDKGAF